MALEQSDTKEDLIQAKRKLSSRIRIKIAPKADATKQNDQGNLSESLINIEQLGDDENPITLKINNKEINSKNKFETFLKYPETIDIMINSPEPEGSESSSSTPKQALADSKSTSSDLRSLFNAYKTNNSNFSAAFKPASGASSKVSTPEKSLDNQQLDESMSEKTTSEETTTDIISASLTPSSTGEIAIPKSSLTSSPSTSDNLISDKLADHLPTLSTEAPKYLPLKPGQRLTDRKELINSTPARPPSLRSIDEVTQIEQPAKSSDTADIVEAIVTSIKPDNLDQQQSGITQPSSLLKEEPIKDQVEKEKSISSPANQLEDEIPKNKQGTIQPEENLNKLASEQFKAITDKVISEKVEKFLNEEKLKEDLDKKPSEQVEKPTDEIKDKDELKEDAEQISKQEIEKAVDEDKSIKQADKELPSEDQLKGEDLNKEVPKESEDLKQKEEPAKDEVKEEEKEVLDKKVSEEANLVGQKESLKEETAAEQTDKQLADDETKPTEEQLEKELISSKTDQPEKEEPKDKQDATQPEEDSNKSAPDQLKEDKLLTDQTETPIDETKQVDEQISSVVEEEQAEKVADDTKSAEQQVDESKPKEDLDKDASERVKDKLEDSIKQADKPSVDQLKEEVLIKDIPKESEDQVEKDKSIGLTFHPEEVLNKVKTNQLETYVHKAISDQVDKALDEAKIKEELDLDTNAFKQVEKLTYDKSDEINSIDKDKLKEGAEQAVDENKSIKQADKPSLDQLKGEDLNKEIPKESEDLKQKEKSEEPIEKIDKSTKDKDELKGNF